jgi:photosystem II stability/assembly factor-like uncharacterized protein
MRFVLCEVRTMKSFAGAVRSVLSLLLLLALPSAAGAAGWKPLGPDHMSIRGPFCLTFDPTRPGRAFAGLSGGGIAQSDDSGATWQMMGGGLAASSVYSIAVQPQNGWVYAVAERGLYRSLDGGRSWSLLRSSVYSLQLDSQHPSVLWIIGAGGLYRSGDGGATWKHIQANLPGWYTAIALLVDPQDSRRIYVSLGGRRTYGLWASEDGGRSWTRRRRRLYFRLDADPHAVGTVLAADGGTLIEKSRDGGRTWEPFFDADSIHQPFAYPVALAADPRQPGKFFLLVNSSDLIPGLYATADGGRHWHTSAAGMARLWEPTAIAFSRDGAALVGGLFYPYQAGVFRSADGGAHWLPASRGLANTTVTGFTVSRRGDLFVAGYGYGIARSRDGGASWSSLSLRTYDPPTAEPIFTKMIADPGDPDTAYAISRYPYDGSGPNIVWKTDDGGASWRRLPYPLAGPAAETQLNAMDLAVDPTDSQTLFLATDGANADQPDWIGLFRSRDGGETWENLLPGIFDELAVHPGAPGWVLVRSIFGIYRSTDHGDHWDKVLDRDGDHYPNWLAVAPSDPQIVYTLLGSELYRSDDGGLTWRSLGHRFFSTIIAVDPLDPDTLVYAQQGVVRLKLGQGKQFLDTGIFNLQPAALLFDPADPRRLIASTDGGGLLEYRFAP